MDELIQNITNFSIFTESVKEYFSNISFNSVIMTIMMIFMVVGAVDKVQGNKRGYGAAFDEGFHAMGPLAIAMVGVIAAAPALCILLQPFITPIYEFFGASPAVFATTLLGCDMGGYPLAMSLAGGDETIGNFAGLIVGSTMGCILLFDIPVALTLIKKQDRSILAFGILLGLVTVPVGCFAGGLCMNLTPYKIDVLTIVQNLIPVTIVAVIIGAGLWFKPVAMMNGFNKFGTAVTGTIAIFTAIAVFQFQTGIRFPLFNTMVEAAEETGISPLTDALIIVGNIALVLIGAFPMVEWVKKTFNKPLMLFGKKLGMNEAGSAGFVASLANNIPVFAMLHEMNPKGKLMNIAFAACGAFILGDHLGFTAGVNKEMILPVIIAKLVAGGLAVLLAYLLADKLLGKAGISEDE